MGNKLVKSTTDKKLAGVCAGIAEYMNVDPTVVRVIYALLTLVSAGFPGVIAYIILAAIMPDR
jgi:phage shock protein C